MNLEKILFQIENFKVNEEMEDYEISNFFDEIRESLTDVNLLTEPQKTQLIKKLFGFLKTQDSEMDASFSFIHFIENIDNSKYGIYESELLKFNTKNGTTTSTLLLNRHINSLNGNEWRKCIELMKSISENTNYTKYVREEALHYYECQMGKNNL